jgi:hypothetical protein
MHSFQKRFYSLRTFSSIRSVVFRSALFAVASLMAMQAQAETMYLLNESGGLATASTADPTRMTTPVQITGVRAGEELLAIDVRPQNQALYALGVDSEANSVTLYLVEPRTAVATPVGSAFTLTTNGVTQVDFDNAFFAKTDIDFNPAVDRLRVIVAGGLNFRINPNTGAPIDGDNGGAPSSVAGVNPDGTINGTVFGGVEGAAYTNNQPNNGGITTLYTLGNASISLYIQGLGGNPNSGTQTVVGQVTYNDGVNGGSLTFQDGTLDILPGVNATASNTPVAAGAGFMVARLGAFTNLYSVNLVDALATLIGTVGDGNTFIRGLALRPDLSPAIALTSTGASLVRFDVRTPGTTTTVNISGIMNSETLVGIDYRPATGQLYGLGINGGTNTGTLYIIDPQTGALTAVGAAGQVAFSFNGFPVPLNTTGYGIDFNPVVDRIRVVAASGLNFRINPITGAPVDSDGNGSNGNTLDASQNGLPGNGGTSGTAYTNSFAGTTVTTQYTLDAGSDSLYIQNPPNSGNQTNPLAVTLGGAPLDFNALSGFDIPSAVTVLTSGVAAQGDGYFVAFVGGTAGLYRVNLTTGAAASLGAIGDGTTPLAGLAVAVAPPVIRVENPANTAVVSGASTLALGSTATGANVSGSFVIKNTGTQSLAYSSNITMGTEFSVSSGGLGTIAAGESAMLTVNFLPTAVGPFTDSITITSNDSMQPSFQVLLSGTGLVPQEIGVEAPVGTIVQDNAGTLDFGSSLNGAPVTRQVKISNTGEVALNYTTGFATGTKYSVTANGSGTVAPGGSTTLTVSYTPTVGTSATDTLMITSNDTSEPIFDIALTGQGLAAQGDDTVVSGNGPTRFQPLANDTLSGMLTITAVSNNAIQIRGRTLVIPNGFTGTFTYTVSNGTTSGQASVTVNAGTPTTAPLSYNGVLTEPGGKVSAWATVTISAKGKGTAKIIYSLPTETRTVTAKLTFPVGTTNISVPTKFGTFTVESRPNGVNGAVGMDFAPTSGGSVSGLLHANVLSATAETHNIELASIDPVAFPGGGYAQATISKKGAVKLKGLLPDGNPFSAASTRTDVSSIAFFATTKTKVKPFGVIGGELTLAANPTTDVTGELVWSKPLQIKGGKGTHLGGVDTTLTAKGSRYDKLLLLPVGNGTLKLAGGNLVANESSAVAITGGIPAVPTGSLVTWKGPTKKGTSPTGIFSVTVTVPGVAKPVKGSGLYLQKSGRAWGYFPGTTLGGRVELSVP